MGRIDAALGDPHRSLDKLLRSLAIVESHPGTDLLPPLLVNIGCTYSDAGEFEEAERYWLRGLEAARGEGDREVERRVLADLGDLHRQRNAPPAALAYLHQSLAAAEAHGDRPNQVMELHVTGQVKAKIGCDADLLSIGVDWKF